MRLYIAGWSFLILANIHAIANNNVTFSLFLISSICSFLLDHFNDARKNEIRN